MERKYIAVKETKWDSTGWFYNDMKSANECAEDVWAHLTDSERKRTRVYVGWIERSSEYVLEADEDDWVDSWHSLDSNNECFDSDKVEEEKMAQYGVICSLFTINDENNNIKIGTQPVFCAKEQCMLWLDDKQKCSVIEAENKLTF